jgi:hypothetical protein
MNPFLSLIAGYKSYLIIGGLVIMMILGLWMWHKSIVIQAEQTMKADRDKYWTELIQHSPVKTDTTFIHVYIPRKDTSGFAEAFSHADSAHKVQIDFLLRTVNNKDSMLIALSTPASGIIREKEVGRLDIIYYPLNEPKTKFAWKLTERPPKDSIIVYVDSKRMVSIPFRTLALSADVNAVGQLYAGFKIRVSDYWMIGTTYQVVGPIIRNNWYDRLRIGVDYYFY